MPKVAKELKTQFEIEAKKGTDFNVGGVIGLKCDYRMAKPCYYMRWTKEGKENKYYIGSLSLKEAKKEARRLRDILDQGKDPNEIKKQEIIRSQEEERRLKEELAQQSNTLRAVAERFFDYGRNAGLWRGSNNGEDKIRAFRNSPAMKELGDVPIKDITPQMLYKHFEPYWTSKPCAADKIHTCLNQIFNWSIAMQISNLERNPADKRGAFGVLIQALTKARKKKENYPAPDYRRINELLSECISYHSTSKKAFIFQVLTATRGEATRTLEWSDIDLKNKVAIVKPENDKGCKEFNDPNRPREIYLSKQVIQLLECIPRVSKFVFFSRERGCTDHIKEEAINKFLTGLHTAKKLKDGIGWVDVNYLDKEGQPRKIVPHGTARATFRTWCAETGKHERASELCLFHLPEDVYGGAYNRALFRDERKKIMQEWSDYCLKGINLKELFD